MAHIALSNNIATGYKLVYVLFYISVMCNTYMSFAIASSLCQPNSLSTLSGQTLKFGFIHGYLAIHVM